MGQIFDFEDFKALALKQLKARKSVLGKDGSLCSAT